MDKIIPLFETMHEWDLYSEELIYEYQQSIEEGIDITKYQELFQCVSALEKGIYKTKLADILFDIMQTAEVRNSYEYFEPSDLQTIKDCRKELKKTIPSVDKMKLKDRISGAWYGRICGCLLGKTVEGIKTDELIPLLKETNNYPMNRYILLSDMTEEILKKYTYPLKSRCFADDIKNAPADDDTNYTVLYQLIIDLCGKEFTPLDVANLWVDFQPKNAYCTAERVAFRNFVNGYVPPNSAIYKNPYREWIGAQIRADYFGYINPGNPEKAAEMAWRDASISHVKNGIYGEMFVAAMIAGAAVCDDIMDVIEIGLGQIPHESRLYKAIKKIVSNYKGGMEEEECFKDIHCRWDENNGHHWCHTISNAEIVVASLLYGKDNYAKSICLSVQTGFDTDCNGATVGSILGMKNGIESIDEEWLIPVKGKLDTNIFNMGTVDISKLIDKTLQHIKQ